MKKLILSFCLLIPFLLGGVASEAAQLSNARYLLRYDSSTCRYEVLMYLETGNINVPAAGIPLQQVYGCQLSIVVPTGTNFGGNGGLSSGTVTTYANEPRTGMSQSGNAMVGGSGASWTNGNNAFNPSSLSGYDIYAFVPPTSGAYFSQASQGDTVLLFSISIVTPTANCGQGVRLWNNNVIQGSAVSGDPNSGSAGLNGRDYNNSLKVGSSSEQYHGTGTPNMNEAKPVVTASVTQNSTTITGTSSATTSSCATISSYAWTGPASFTASTSGFTRSNIPANTGNYILTVTNSLGCSTVWSHVIVLPVKLLSFDAMTEGCQARLNWVVAPAQMDLKAFDIQYSQDGINFETIGHLERTPNSDQYSFAYAQASGKGYYRLMIIEQSGITEYTKTVSVSTTCNVQVITIAPNPTTGRSVVSGIESGDQVKVSDVLGNVIANYVSSGSTAAIDLSIYPSGIYSVIVSRNSQILKTDKITKQ